MTSIAQHQFSTTPLGEKILFDVNRHAFDKVDSASTYKRLFGDLLATDKAAGKPFIYFVIGTDSGLLAEWLAHQSLRPDTRFLFIELPEVIGAVRERIATLFDADSYALCTIDHWKDLIAPWKINEHVFTNSFRQLISIAGRDAHLAGYHGMYQQLRNDWNAYRHQLRAELENRIYIERQLENCPDNLWPANLVKNQFQDWPAVVLGGGPSLDEILPWVEERRDRLLVIAVSRIARQLLDRGLIPDIVVSIDPQEISFDISKQMLQFPDSVLFINSYHVEPHLLGQWHGTAMYCGNRFPWDSALNVDNLSVHGPTVTNTALSLAIYMGCPQVILAGVDLCFTREGHTHSSGSNERQASPRLSTVTQVETNAGALADSNLSFTLAIDFMGEQAGVGVHMGREIINPSSTAAKIPNVTYRPLGEIEIPQQPASVTERLHHCYPDESDQHRNKQLKDLSAELARAHSGFRRIVQLSEEALTCNASQFVNPKHKQRMDKIERELDNKLSPYSKAVKLFSTADFLALSRVGKDRTWTEDEVLSWGESYYRIYKDGASTLLAHVEQAQQKLNNRRQELSDRADIDALFACWLQDNTPARAAIWRSKHPDVVLDEAKNEQFNELARDFERQLSERDTLQLRGVKESAQLDLHASLDKMHRLFRGNDDAELQRLADQLATLDDPIAPDMTHMAQGYIAELNGDINEAYRLYNTIVDNAAEKLSDDGEPENKNLLEDALRQMSTISLNRGDLNEALAALDVLSALSSSYSPQYAELLGLAGRLEDAVNVYTEYLNNHPDDLGTMLKLGKLFQDNGIVDAARQAYEYVLSRDPENLTAKQGLTPIEA